MDQPTDSIAMEIEATSDHGRRVGSTLPQWIARWLLFFLICTGLGYAGVERYQPRAVPALSDSALYYRLVAGEPVQSRDMRFRILVPYVARPFYSLIKRFLDQQRAVFLALLIANSIFCATTSCLLVSVGLRLTGNVAVALLAACLYLLNFAIANLQLAGMVDGGEAFFMMALTWSLLFDRWWLLPVWGLCGALAKETFVPLAGIFTFGWWLSSQRKATDRVSKLFWTMALVIVGLVTITVARLSIAGSFSGSAGLSGGSSSYFVGLGGLGLQSTPGPGYLSRFVTALSSRSFWYVFIWLLPLGIASIRRLPRAWVIASILTAVVALALGLYRNIEGNVARPIFDVVGPLFSLGAAIWLTGTLVESKTLRVD